MNYILQLHIKKTPRVMMRKLKVTSGLLQENSFIVITLNPELNCTCREKNQFLTPLKYIDVTRTTYTSLDVLLEKIVKITGTWMEKKNCQMHGQASQDLFY